MSGHLTPQEVRKRLSLIRVAKDVFLSEWYQAASDTLISPEGRATLRRVAAESLAEREAALQLVEEWAERDYHDQDEVQGVRAMQATMALDFLDSLAKIKHASAEVLQRAAAVAPDDLAHRFLELANLDLAHALQLRRLVLDEFPDPGDLMSPQRHHAHEAPAWREEALPPEYGR